MHQSSTHRWGAAALAGFVASCLPLIASAQALEEIVVTATKREQSLQDVPLSISAISGETLENFSISNFYDMDIPGVNIAQGGMNDNAFIRGIGQSSGNFGFENSAPYYIDGIYYGRARGTRLAWLDTERIEVLKGPVPTYLGKNASAGGINIVSRRPTDQVDGFIDIYNEFEHSEVVVNGAISGPLSDTFRARAAIKYRDLQDGWMTNTVTGLDEPAQEDTLARLSAEWDVTDSLQIYAKIETVDAQWEGRNTQQTNCAPTAVIDPALEDCIFNETRAVFADPTTNHADIWDRNYAPGTTFINDFEYIGGSLIIEWDLGDAVLTSTTGYYDFQNTFLADASHSTFDRGLAEFQEFYEQTSQEIRVASSGNSSIDWMAGVYYDTNNNENTTRNSLPGAMAMIVFRDNDEDADSYAVFGEVGFNLSDTVTAKVGGRYTDYEKDNFYRQQIWVGLVPGQPPSAAMAVGMATFSIPNTQGDSKFQPAIGLEWRPNDDTMYYITAKEGFKAGGLDHQATNPSPERQRIEAEEVTAVEIGAKWTLADGRARINASLFNAEYDNYQVSLFDPINIAFVTGNAGAATTRGLEIDADFAVTDSFRLSAYLSFLDAEWDDYEGVNCYLNPVQTAAEGCVPLLDANGNPTGSNGQDLSGTPLQFAPDLSGTVTADYRVPISGDIEFFGNVSLFFTDDYQISPDGDPDQAQDGYTKIDARLGVEASDRRWTVALVGRNLTDEFVFEWTGNAPLSPGAASNFSLLKRTRQVAVQGVYRFGE